MQVFGASQIYTPDNLRADNKADAPGKLRDIIPPRLTLVPTHQPKICIISTIARGAYTQLHL